MAYEEYTVVSSETVHSRVADAIKYHPDIIYFAGYARDASQLITSLGKGSQIKIVGGDALYVIGDYPPAALQFINQKLYFTGFAHYDEWEKLANLPRPAFFTEYKDTFNHNNFYDDNTYGSSLADGVAILSYDAMNVLFKGYENAQQQTQQVTPQSLQEGLHMIDSYHVFQGISGGIAFASSGDPINRTLLVMRVERDDTGKIKVVIENDVLNRQFFKVNEH